jgi:hypothetical protein
MRSFVLVNLELLDLAQAEEPLIELLLLFLGREEHEADDEGVPLLFQVELLELDAVMEAELAEPGQDVGVLLDREVVVEERFPQIGFLDLPEEDEGEYDAGRSIPSR